MDIPVQQVIKEIKEKISFEGSDHGLFQPAVKGNKARWFKLNHSLKFYNLPQDTEVVFKKMTRPMKVRLVDNTTKTILVNDATKVSVIRDTIGRKIGIASCEEYGLKVVGSDVWLALNNGLYEQDVKEEDILLFDKNYFFFDDTIDRSNPVQLHLIYTKAVQSIVEGTYPVTNEQGAILGGIQAQVLIGNFDPAKHTPVFYQLATYLPAANVKSKKTKPKLLQEQLMMEHRKLVNTTEVNAKYKYVQTVRQLPTYGMTFYTVQIPVVKKKGKKKSGKMQDILIGITREKVLQMDIESKEVIREYPLVHLKRWAAVRGKFTFDFGDHEDEYWTVFTPEGNQMSQLISGYIDIIINARKQGVKQIEIDQKTGLAAEEDIAVSGYASAGYVVGNAGRGAGATTQGRGGPGTVRPQSMEIQVTDVGSAMQVADLVRSELSKPISAAERRNTRRESVVGAPQWIEQIVSYEKGTDDDIEELLDAVMSGNISKPELDRIAGAIAGKLKNFAPLAQRLAAAGADEQAIQDAAQLVTQSVADILRNADAVTRNPYDAEAKQLLQAAKQKYDAAMLLMKAAQNNELNDQGTAELIEALQRAIAMSVDQLQYDAQEYGTTLQGQQAGMIENFTKQLQPAADGLKIAATTLSKAVLNPNARNHVIDAGQFLGSLANQLDGVTRRFGATPEWLDRIGRSAATVNDSIALLVQALSTAEDRGLSVNVDDPINRANAALRSLKDANGNQKAMLAGIKALASAANDIIRQGLGVAKVSSPLVKQQLEEQCGLLKSFLQDLTEVGKEAIKHPNDLTLRGQMLDVAEKVTDAMGTLASDLKNITANAALRAATKSALGSAFALSQGVTLGLFIDPVEMNKVTDPTVNPRHRMRLEASAMGDSLHNLLDSLRSAVDSPQNTDAQDELLAATKQLGPQMAKFVATTKRHEGEIEDYNRAAVNSDGKATQDSVQKLLGAVQGAQNADSSGTDITQAVKAMEGNDAQIESAEFSAMSDLLVAGDRDGAIEVAQQFAEQFNQNVDGLYQTSIGKGPLGPSANDVTNSFGDFITAAEGLAGNLDKEAQKRMFESLKALSLNTGDFLKAVKNVRLQKGSKDSQTKNKDAKEAVNKSMAQLLGIAMGKDTKDIDNAISAVNNEMKNLRPAADGKDFAQAAKTLAQRNKAIHAASQQLANVAKSNPKRAGATAKIVATMAKNLVLAANSAAGAASEEVEQTKLINQSRSVLDNTLAVLEAAAATTVTGASKGLDDAVQRLGASVAALEGSTTGSSFPEVDKAVNSVFLKASELNGNGSGQPGRSRREILRDLDDATAQLTGNMAGLISAARMGTAKVGIYAQGVGENSNKIVDSALAARAPLSNQAQINLDPVIEAYVGHCDTILSNPANSKQVGPSTVQLGQLTRQLGSKARATAQSLASTPDRQKVYVNSAKALAAGVPKLVAAVKSGKPALISKCADFLKTTAQKLEAARLGVTEEELSGGADGAVPKAQQEALTESATQISTTSAQLLQASSQLAGDPTNLLLANNLTEASENLQEAIQSVNVVARSLDPVKGTCQATATALSQALADLDAVLVNAGMGLLEKPAGKSLTDQKAQLAELVQSFAPDITTLHGNRGGRDVQQGAERVALKIPQLVNTVSDTAALILNPAGAKKIVTQAKGFTSGLRDLVRDVETGGENVESVGQQAADKLGELLSSLKQAEDLLSEMLNVSKKVRGTAAQLNVPGKKRDYAEIKDSIVAAARTTTSAGSSLQTQDFKNIGAVDVNAKSLARSLPPLVNLVRDGLASIPEQNTAAALKEATEDLIDSSADLIAAAREVASGDDLTSRAELKESWGTFMEAMPQFLAAVKRGAKGESAIDDGAESIAQVINRLNGLAIFAEAGLDLEGVKQSSASYDQMIPKVIAGLEKLAHFAPNFAKAGSISEDQLGAAVAKFANGVSGLAEAALSSADKAPDSESQINIINATKAVALTAKQLVLASKDVNKDQNDVMAQRTLTSAVSAFPLAAKTLTSVLKGEGRAEAPAVPSGGSPMEKAISGVMDIASVRANAAASPQTLIEAARNVSSSATPLVFAASQDDFDDGALEAMHTMRDMIADVKGAAKANPAVAPKLQSSAKTITQRMVNLLEASSNLDRSLPGVSEKITHNSAALNAGLEGLVSVINEMPGGSGITLHTAESIAERTHQELNAAAEYVKRVVSNLPKVPVGDGESEKSLISNMANYVHSIADATARLIAASEDAEKESRERGDAKYRSDPTWANGLISASHKVASGVGRLAQFVEKAKDGSFEENDLIATAKHVAACVKHLQMASKSRQGITDSTQFNIGDSSKNVARGTANTVKAARALGDMKQKAAASQSRSRSASSFGVAGGIAAKLEQQSMILRLERELEEARRGYLNLNKEQAAAGRKR
eukprot:TRINITY_DN3568_c0_g1_i1.p1 TRINITY_DN3568_c0_g1~~TRINITY_DN3568_c0_g1_i1.p1  ORF type:complete len:2426 (+),score=783.97 TRINITY_DN3568_c0_g1_i1:67-7278(+)